MTALAKPTPGATITTIYVHAISEAQFTTAARLFGVYIQHGATWRDGLGLAVLGPKVRHDEEGVAKPGVYASIGVDTDWHDRMIAGGETVAGTLSAITALFQATDPVPLWTLNPGLMGYVSTAFDGMVDGTTARGLTVSEGGSSVCTISLLASRPSGVPRVAGAVDAINPLG